MGVQQHFKIKLLYGITTQPIIVQPLEKCNPSVIPLFMLHAPLSVRLEDPALYLLKRGKRFDLAGKEEWVPPAYFSVGPNDD